MINFTGAPELQQLIDDPQSLRMLAESTDTTDQKRALQQLFTRLMKADGNRVRQTISTLVDRLQTDSSRHPFIHSYIIFFAGIAPFSLKDLIVRLNEQYPGGDVGVLAPYFLNHFFLDPGEASFLGPNEPHAYLAGGI
jgi:mannose-6-phosphate isomerase